jgi:hypothetical protein
MAGAAEVLRIVEGTRIVRMVGNVDLSPDNVINVCRGCSTTTKDGELAERIATEDKGDAAPAPLGGIVEAFDFIASLLSAAVPSCLAGMK